MSFVAQGTATLTTTNPNGPKVVVSVEGTDTLVYWASDTELALRCQDPDNWSTTLSGPSSFTVAPASVSTYGTSRIFPDTVDSTRWLIWPVVNGTQLHIAGVHLDGDADGLTSTVQTYSSAVEPNESLVMLAATETSVGAFLYDNDTDTYTLRNFSYSTTVFNDLTFTMDVSKTSSPHETQFIGFDPTSTAYLGRDRVFTARIDGAATRALFIDANIVANAIDYALVVNTTTGLPPNPTRLGNMRLSGDRVVLLYETAASDGIATMDATDGGNAATATLTASGSLASAKCLTFSSTSAILTLPAQTAAVKFNPSDSTINSESTSFVGGPATLAVYNGVDVLIGANGNDDPVLGVRAETTLGDTTAMGAAASTVLRLGDIQAQALSNAYYAELGTGATLTLYGLTSAPAQGGGTPVSASYVNRTQLNSSRIQSLGLLPNGYHATTTASAYGLLSPSGTLTTFPQSVSTFGDIAVAPNSDVFFNTGSNLYVSSGGNTNPTLVTPSLGGGQSGGTAILANGAIVTGSNDGVVNVWDNGSLTQMTNVTSLNTIYLIQQLANGNMLMGDRDASRFYFVDVSVAGGAELSSFQISSPALSQPVTSFKYDTDKFFVSAFNNTVFDLDAATQTATAVSITNAGGQPSPGSGYGISIAPNGDLYQGSFSNGFFVAEPAP